MVRSKDRQHQQPDPLVQTSQWLLRLKRHQLEQEITTAWDAQLSLELDKIILAEETLAESQLKARGRENGGKPDPVDRLRQILQQLPEAERAIVWEGVALGVAARC